VYHYKPFNSSFFIFSRTPFNKIFIFVKINIVNKDLYIYYVINNYFLINFAIVTRNILTYENI